MSVQELRPDAAPAGNTRPGGTMIKALVRSEDGRTTTYQDVRLLSAGVLVTVDPESEDDRAEVLIPWHRVMEVYSSTFGAIALELSQG